MGWPRNYRPVPDPTLPIKGGQIALPDTRAFSGGLEDACDVAMASPWGSAYTAEYPAAVYEQGNVYCLAWPTVRLMSRCDAWIECEALTRDACFPSVGEQKNHVLLPASCTNPQSKSDAGTDDDIYLFVSPRNPTRDPTQPEFNQRNINELAGLASSCDPGLREGSNAKTDACQLGLERHADGERDCRGFLRAPKACESSGFAMGHGCFRIPEDMTPGHYVANWYWRTTFARTPNDQTIPYTTCFDFTVVARGAAEANPGPTGTTGDPISDLPCTNNALTLSMADGGGATTDGGSTAEPPPIADPDTGPGAEDDCEGSPQQEGAECAWPPEVMLTQRCCAVGLRCVLWEDSGYGRCRKDPEQPAVGVPEVGDPSPLPTEDEQSSPGPSEGCQGDAIAGEECARPEWENEVCCAEGTRCAYWQGSGYGRCRAFGPGASPRAPAQPEEEAGGAGCQLPGVEEGGECAWPASEGRVTRCCEEGTRCELWQNTEWGRCRAVV